MNVEINIFMLLLQTPRLCAGPFGLHFRPQFGRLMSCFEECCLSREPEVVTAPWSHHTAAAQTSLTPAEGPDEAAEAVNGLEGMACLDLVTGSSREDSRHGLRDSAWHHASGFTALKRKFVAEESNVPCRFSHPNSISRLGSALFGWVGDW